MRGFIMQTKNSTQLMMINTPEFETILWDNMKTTAYYGGMVTGCVGAIPGAVVGGVIGLITLDPFALPYAGIGGAYALGAPIAVVGGSLSALCFSLPFSLAAVHTRKFKNNSQIDKIVKILSFVKDKSDQEKIIDQILAEDNLRDCWGVRSYESTKLVDALKRQIKKKASKEEEENLLEEKWQALLNYMSEQNGSANYVHNGKKLFNTILGVVPNIANDRNFVIRNVVQANDLVMLDRYLEKEPSLLNSPIFNRMSLLHYAVVEGFENVACHLITNYTDRINFNAKIRSTDNTPEKTALHLAAEQGQVRTVCTLIRAGANLNCGDLEDHPIHIAAKNGHSNLVQMLIHHDYELINLPNKLNQTPLMYAAANGFKEVVKYLVQNGAELDTKLNDIGHVDHDKNALQLSEDSEHEAITNYLAANGAYDPKTEKSKNELKKIVDILNSPRWNEAGWGLFCNHVPQRVEWLRKYILTSNIGNVDQLNRQEVRKHADMMKNIVNLKNSIQREGSQGTLYRLIDNLGENNEEDFNLLNAFRYHPMDSLEDYTNIAINF